PDGCRPRAARQPAPGDDPRPPRRLDRPPRAGVAPLHRRPHAARHRPPGPRRTPPPRPPPPPRPGRRPVLHAQAQEGQRLMPIHETNRKPVNHAETAAALRAQPGVWLPVGEYRNRMTADGIARCIRSGSPLGTRAYPTPYTPTGAFEARTRLTDDGTLVEARYTEGRALMTRATRPVGMDDRRRIQPSSDAQRVLGQIERGEVRAGADAARQIAARHQAAYGDAVWGPTTTASTTTDSVSGDQ